MVDKLSCELQGKDVLENPGSHAVIPEISHAAKCI